MLTTLVVQRSALCPKQHDCDMIVRARELSGPSHTSLCKVIFVHRAFKGRCVCALITLYRRLKSLWDVSHFGSSRVVSVSFVSLSVVDGTFDTTACVAVSSRRRGDRSPPLQRLQSAAVVLLKERTRPSCREARGGVCPALTASLLCSLLKERTRPSCREA